MPTPLAGLVLAMLAAPAPARSADEVVRLLAERQRATRDLSARFVQSYRSGLIGRELTERGTVQLKRPGLMRWEYTEPERKTFVSDGRRFFFYVPADRQVIVREQAGQRGVAATLLSGQQSLAEEFEAAIESGPARGAWRLRLVPRAADPEVDRVYLELDDALRVTGLEIHDPQGGVSRFRFEAIRENTGLGDGVFRFEIPKGVEVLAG